MWRPRSKRVSPVAGDEDRTAVAEDIADVPAWVNHFRRWGVPVAAILVLVLCAPGEQHLGDLAGWGGRMSWGLSGLFTLYAGLAAVISTQLPQGARGKTSSVWGAFLSLLLAMAAQPVSHLFVTGYISAEPKPPLWLVGTVSSIPPLILGHLLHFAAMGAAQRPSVPLRDKDTSAPVASVTPIRPRPVPPPVPAVPQPVSRPAVPPAVPALPLTQGTPAGQNAGHPAGQTVPSLSLVKGQTPGQLTPSMTSRAMSLFTAGLSEDTVRDKLRSEYSVSGVPPKTNSINKAVTRAKARIAAVRP